MGLLLWRFAMVDLILCVQFGLEGCRGGLSSRSAAGVSSLWVCCCCHGFSLWVRFIAVLEGCRGRGVGN